MLFDRQIPVFEPHETLENEGGLTDIKGKFPISGICHNKSEV